VSATRRPNLAAGNRDENESARSESHDNPEVVADESSRCPGETSQPIRIESCRHGCLQNNNNHSLQPTSFPLPPSHCLLPTTCRLLHSSFSRLANLKHTHVLSPLLSSHSQMASACNDYFSVWDLEGNSRETEVIQSTHCLPNRVKFGLLLLWLVSYVLLLVLTLAFLTKEYLKSRRWTPQKRNFILLSYCAASKSSAVVFLCCEPLNHTHSLSQCHPLIAFHGKVQEHLMTSFLVFCFLLLFLLYHPPRRDHPAFTDTGGNHLTRQVPGFPASGPRLLPWDADCL